MWDLFILRFRRYFKTILPLNITDMLVFGLLGSGKSHPVLGSVVKALLIFQNFSFVNLLLQDLFYFSVYIYMNWVCGLSISLLIYILPEPWVSFGLVTDISFFSLTDFLVKCLNWFLVFVLSFVLRYCFHNLCLFLNLDFVVLSNLI